MLSPDEVDRLRAARRAHASAQAHAGIGGRMDIDGGELIEIGLEVSQAVESVAAAVKPTGPGGKKVTAAEAMKVLKELTEAAAAVAKALAD